MTIHPSVSENASKSREITERCLKFLAVDYDEGVFLEVALNAADLRHEDGLFLLKKFSRRASDKKIALFRALLARHETVIGTGDEEILRARIRLFATACSGRDEKWAHRVLMREFLSSGAGDLQAILGARRTVTFPALASIVLEEAQSALPHLLARQDASPLEKVIGSVAHVFSSRDVNALTDLLGTLRRQIRESGMRMAIRARRFDEAAALAAAHQGISPKHLTQAFREESTSAMAAKITEGDWAGGHEVIKDFASYVPEGHRAEMEFLLLQAEAGDALKSGDFKTVEQWMEEEQFPDRRDWLQKALSDTIASACRTAIDETRFRDAEDLLSHLRNFSPKNRCQALSNRLTKRREQLALAEFQRLMNEDRFAEARAQACLCPAVIKSICLEKLVQEILCPRRKLAVSDVGLSRAEELLKVFRDDIPADLCLALQAGIAEVKVWKRATELLRVDGLESATQALREGGCSRLLPFLSSLASNVTKKRWQAVVAALQSSNSHTISEALAQLKLTLPNPDRSEVVIWRSFCEKVANRKSNHSLPLLWESFCKISFPKAHELQLIFRYYERAIPPRLVRWGLNRGDWDLVDLGLSKIEDEELRKNLLQEKARKICDLLSGQIEIDKQQAAALAAVSTTVRIVARAGSGKTRTLVATGCFLLQHRKIDPSEILMLAFNRTAAAELRERISSFTGKSFFSAMTFHSLAYSICKPEERLLSDRGSTSGAMELSSLVHGIVRRAMNHRLRLQVYELFRSETRLDEATGALLEGKDYYNFRRTMQHVTLGGYSVRSRGEKFIGDFLFEYGIEHRYEPAYRWDDKIYHPDFEILTANGGRVILEHWATNPDGREKGSATGWSDEELDAYRATAQDKRAFWKEKKTPLIETLAAETADRNQFETLLAGYLLDHLPLTKLPESERLEKVVDVHQSTLSSWIAKGIQRTQKRGWDNRQLQAALREHSSADARETIFLGLLSHVFPIYEEELERLGRIDFDRLLNQAACKLEDPSADLTLGTKGAKVDLRKLKVCLVDEAQDLSPHFVSLLLRLRAINPGMRFIFVGDDWQAINRFAGSEVKLFATRIESDFAPCETVSLEKNYRSCITVVEAGNQLMAGRGVPGRAVSVDETSIELINYDRTWIHASPDRATHAELERDKSFTKVSSVVGTLLKTIYVVAAPDLRSGKGVGVVFRTSNLGGKELGQLRSHFLESLVARAGGDAWGGDLDKRIRFDTAHSFKGLQHDTILLVDPHSGRFPLIHTSTELFRIFGDSIEQAAEDERRLFYVAITRACRRLVLLCRTERLEDSPFLKPLQPFIRRMKVVDRPLRDSASDFPEMLVPDDTVRHGG